MILRSIPMSTDSMPHGKPLRWLFGVLTLVLWMALANLANAGPISTEHVASPQAAFTSGNLVLYRVGDGSAALSNAANPVFLDEYSPTGTLVQSIPMPTAISGSNRRLVASGTATSEGLLTLSGDTSYIVLTGYDAAVGTASIANTTAAAVNRVVGRVDASGAVDTTTALTDAFDANNVRSVCSTNGSDLWVSGTGATSASAGVRYTTLGSTTSTQLSTTVTNLRQSHIFAGQLYISTGSGSTVRIGTVGTGTPTTSGQTIANLPGFPTGGSPYSFFLTDLTNTVAGVDTLYVADDGAALLTKYSLVGGSWTSNGTVGTSGDAYRGLAGRVTGTAESLTVTLYATRKASELVTMADTSGYNGVLSGAPTLLATAATNTAFRGVAFTPGTPLAVTLATFNAEPQGGQVVVTWETVSELNNAGFNLYRSSSVDGADRALLAFVPSQSPGSTAGASYSVTDAAVTAGQTYWYLLEDVDLNGAMTLHGPVSATGSAPTAVTLASLQATPVDPLTPPVLGSLAALAALAGAAWTVRRRLR